MDANKRILLLTMGYACFIVACTQSFIPNGAENVVSESLWARMSNNVAFVAAYALYAALFTKRGVRVLGTAASVLPSAVAAATQVAFFLCDQRVLALNDLALTLLHAATGWSMATLFAFWAGTAYLFDSRQFRYGIFAGSLMSCFAVIFVSAAGSPGLVLASKELALAASALLAAELLSRAGLSVRGEAAGGPLVGRPSKCVASLLLPCACAGALGFAYQYTGIVSMSDATTTLFFTVGEAFAVSVVFLLVTMPVARPLSMLRTFRLLCPVTFVALAMAAFAQGSLRLLSVGISSAAFNLCLILLMPLCADLGRRGSVSIAGLYAGAACFANVFPTLGYLCGVGLGEGSAALAGTAFGGCGLMVLAVALLARRVSDEEIDLSVSDVQALLEYAQQKGGVVIGRGYAAGEIARDYGLSEREREVLELLLQGKMAPQISSSLGISPSTVKTHLRKIFQKTDLHSRGDLIDLSGEYEARLASVGGLGAGQGPR